MENTKQRRNYKAELERKTREHARCLESLETLEALSRRQQRELDICKARSAQRAVAIDSISRVNLYEQVTKSKQGPADYRIGGLDFASFVGGKDKPTKIHGEVRIER